jgi:hypothetical protein
VSRDALASAVDHARRIRRNLTRRRRDVDLGGDCGFASILLAAALGNSASLRATADTCGRLCTPHVWNCVAGTIIDITATQFNDCMESFDAGEPPVFDVLVTKQPRIYHRPVAHAGRDVLDYLTDWYARYEERDRRLLQGALKKLEPRKRRIAI